MHSYIARALLASAALLGASAPALAQTRTPVRSTGFILNVRLGGTNYSPKNGDGSTGGDFGIGLGWAFTPNFALLLNGDGAAFSVSDLAAQGNTDVTLAHGDLLARYSFHSPTSIFVPYLEGGYTRRTFQTNDDVDINNQNAKLSYSGNAFTVGGGINFFFNQALALDLGARVSLGKFDTVKFGGSSVTDASLEQDATTSRFNVGLTWYPMKGK